MPEELIEVVVLTSAAPSHRASYRLEVGIWRARCKVCGWEVTDPARRQAASLFRRHIVATRSTEFLPLEIDLRDDVDCEDRVPTTA